MAPKLTHKHVDLLVCFQKSERVDPGITLVPHNSILPSDKYLMSPGLIIIFSPQALLTVEEDNIIIYIEGYISHKITKMVCSKCAAGLVGLLNKVNSSHVFIAAKQYQDLPTGGLVVPSLDLMEVCILIEA